MSPTSYQLLYSAIFTLQNRIGAGDRTRTGTVLLPGDFKSPVSAIPPHRRISAQLEYHNVASVSTANLSFSQNFEKTTGGKEKFFRCMNSCNFSLSAHILLELSQETRGGKRMNEEYRNREPDLDEWLYGEEWIISER